MEQINCCDRRANGEVHELKLGKQSTLGGGRTRANEQRSRVDKINTRGEKSNSRRQQWKRQREGIDMSFV